MIDLKNINPVNFQRLITSSKQFNEEQFTRKSLFRDYLGNRFEDELPEELRFDLGAGLISYLEYGEYTEYDDFFRKIERHDFMANYLEKYIQEARLKNVSSGGISTCCTSFYQGYENGEFPGKRTLEKKQGLISLSLQRTDKGFDLYIEPVLSMNRQ